LFLDAALRQSKQRFELEALEPRVLLSADALLAGAALASSVHNPLHHPVAQEHSAAGLGALQEASYHPESQMGGMFEGMAVEAITPAPTTPATPQSTPSTHSSEPSQAPAAPAESSKAVVAQVAVQAPVAKALPVKVSTTTSSLSPAVVVNAGSVMTAQLTQTLTAANAPPAASAPAAGTVSASLQTVGNPLVTTSSTASTKVATASLSSSTSTVSQPKPASSPLDLAAQILNELNSIANGGSATIGPLDASLGGVLSLTGVQVTFSNITKTGNTLTGGTVTISAASATLQLGGAITSTIGTGKPGDITGTYDVVSRGYSLSLNSVNVAVSSFISVTATSASFTYDSNPSDATTVTVTNGTSTVNKSVSMMTLGMTGVSVFAGLNGPASNSGATGVSLDCANLALVMFKPTNATDSSFYYALKASAHSLSAVGLPSGVDVSATDIAAEVSGSYDGTHVVDFTQFAGGKLTVATGADSSEDFTYSGPLLKVEGTVNLDVTTYIHIHGSVSFEKVGSQVTIVAGQTAFGGASDITFKLGSADEPFFSATGAVALRFDTTSFTILNASLTVNGAFKLGPVAQVDTPSVAVSNITVDKATGDITGVMDPDGTVHDPVVTITAASAAILPGNTTLTATVSATAGGDGLGFQATFNLKTFAFSVTLEEFHLAVGTLFTADASGVVISYDPANADPHQQLVEIGSGTIDFATFGINGSITNLAIYKDGFHFDSVTLTKTGEISLGSILKVTDPSITLTDFGVTFTSGNASFNASGSITLAAANLQIKVGSADFTGTNLAISFNLAPDQFGHTTITAGTLEFQLSTWVTIEADDVLIQTNPVDGDPYLSVGSAKATLKAGSLALTGTANDFAVVNSGGTAEFQAGGHFGVSFSATPANLHLPTWLGFQVQQLALSWTDFTHHPEAFTMVLSASITSIQGLPGGVEVSGSIDRAVIDFGKLEAGQFPITSIESFSGGIDGNLFGMHITASFVLGIVSLNAENQIVHVADGTVTDPATGDTISTGADLTVVQSVMYVGVSGGAEIEGLGGVQIYLGFSSLGPLTFFVKAEIPILLDPDTGISIGGFSAGVSFNESLPTPGSPIELRGTAYKSPDQIDVTQWQAELQRQTINQYLSSNGGTDLTAAYSQPMIIRAGVTVFDAYLSEHSFKIEGNIAIGLDPSNPAAVKILLTGTATFMDSLNFKAYLFADIQDLTFTFLLDAPAETPIETIGGKLSFGFLDEHFHVIHPTVTQNPDGTFTPSEPIKGFFISVDGFAQFSALGTLTVTVSGSVTLSVTTTMAKLDLSGKLNVSALGDLADCSGEVVADYSNASHIELYGALQLTAGAGLAKLQAVGLYIDDAALTVQLNTTLAPRTVYLPSPDAPHDPDQATPFNLSGATILEVSITGTRLGTFAKMHYEVSGNTVFYMEGAFDLSIDTTGLQLFANLNALKIGPSDASFVSFQGNGLFVINAQGLAAAITLHLSAGTEAEFSTGFKLNGTFNLVMNTTSNDVVYNIPATLPPVTVPGTSTLLTTMTIPRGPPQGLLQADGTFASYGAAGPYIVVTGTGTLGISIGSLDALSFQGFFRFELSSSSAGPVVSLLVNMQGDVLGFANVNVTGALLINSKGVVALLAMDLAAGKTTDFGAGVTLTANFQLAINSTNTDVSNIGGIDLKDDAGNTLKIVHDIYVLFGTGTLKLSVGGAGFEITGSIFTSVSGTVTTLTVSGKLTATVAGATLLTMNANGVLVADTGGTNPGIAGELTLSVTAGDPLSGTGYSFNGNFDLELNTTLVSQSVQVGTSTVTIAAGPNNSSTGAAYVQVHALGSLIFGTSSNNFSLTGDFYLAISTNGLAVSAVANLGITVGGTSLFSVSASGALLIASDGLAATLTVSVSFNGPSSNGSSFGFSMGGTFTLTVNTTGRDVQVGAVSIPARASGLAAGPYFLISVPDAHVILGDSSNGFNLSLSLTLTVSAQGLAMSGNGSLSLKVAGANLFSFTANGGLLITKDGMAAKMDLSISSGASGNGFAFDSGVSFLLEINTTSAAVPTINSLTVNLPAGPYVEVYATGHLTVAGLVNISGSFTFTMGTGGVELSLNATANIMGTVFNLNGAAGIYSDGIAINFALGVSGGGTVVRFLAGVITVDAQFVLQINTTGTTHLGVAGSQQFRLAIHGSSGSGDAKVYVFGFKFTGQLEIKIVSGTFDAAGSLSFDFFGFTTLDITFHFNSNGKYTFTGSSYVRLGSKNWNVHGSLYVRFSNEAPPQFELHVDGGVTAFGHTFASIGADVQINGTSVDISVYVSIDLGLFSIGGTVHIHLGSLASVPAPPPPAIAQVLPGGVLQLNLGVDASNRGVNALADEEYDLSLVGTNADGSQNLSVYAPGVYGQAITYNNVTSIVVHNTSTSNTTIQVAGEVTVPVTITAGSGKNQFILGGGHATITGTTGTDKVIGGSGGVTFHAGTGSSIFVVGSGNNALFASGPVTVLASGYHAYTLSDTALVSDGFTTSLAGTFAITLTTASTGGAAFTVTNYSHTVTLDGNGNPNATASVTLDASLTLDGSVITESNGGVITLKNIPSLALYGGASANTFTINSWSGTAPLTLDGKDGGDTYKVNFVGSGTYTVNVNDSGTSGVDALLVNGTAGNDVLTVSGNSIARASETVNYSGVENITLNTFAGTDTVTVNNPSAALVINGGNGNDLFTLNAISKPLTLNTGTGTNTVNVPAMNAIQALLSLNGGGTETVNLNDTADDTANSGVLGAGSLTGFFGAGGSMNYSDLETLNLSLGNGGNTLTISGRSGLTNVTSGSGADIFNVLAAGGTTNLNAGAGSNTLNVGSLVFNNGTGRVDKVQGTLNYTGSGNDQMNVDGSGSSSPETATLRANSLKFFDPLTINFTGVASLNIALSQAGDIFAVVDTFTSAAVSPVVVVNGNGGDDNITVLDTHAVMTVNGGDGNDSMYVFGNSAVLNLNGNDGDDTFYIYASLHENTSNVDPGASSPAGNTVYSYRSNAAVNIDGGSGHDRVFIFGTVLNDIITINGTHITGAGLNITLANIEELVVVGLGGDDTFYVLSVTVPTTLIGDGSLVPNPPLPPDVTLPDLTGGAQATSFNDTFYIGWQGQSYIPGSLGTIQAPLTLQGNEGIDTVYVDDSGTTANTRYTLTGTTFVSSSMGAEGIITYDNTVDNLNIKAGAGDDTLVINGNGTGAQTTLYGGPGNDQFIVNGDPLLAPLALVGDANTFWGDTLTVNGAGEGNNFVLTGFTIDGAGATISYSQIESLTVNALGASSFVVNGTSIPTTLNGSVDSDRFTVNSSSASLTLHGAAGADTVTINGNSGPLSVTGDAGNDSFTVNGNSGSLTLSGGEDNDTVVINGSSSGSVLVANGDAGNDTFTVNALSAPATLNGGLGDDSFTVNAPLAASPTIIGGGGMSDTLTVNGTVGNDFWLLTGSSVGGVGATVNYSELFGLVVNGISGNDVYNVRSTSTLTTLNTGTGLNVVNVGSFAPVTGGVLDNVQGGLVVVGNGHDTLNIDDTGSALAKTGTLTATTLSGLGLGGGITYTGVRTLNLNLGSGNDTLGVEGTNATTLTTITTGAGSNTITIGSHVPLRGRIVDNIQGFLMLVGSGQDTLNVDDSRSTLGKTGFLTAMALTGLGMGVGGITYSGISTLNIYLGAGNDTFNVESTSVNTTTTLDTGAGTNTIRLGSHGPAMGGTVYGLLGPVSIGGSGHDSMTVDDSGSTDDLSGTLTPTTLTGLGMGAGGITYSGLANLSVVLGSGDDTFTVQDMNDATLTSLDGGLGTNNAVLQFGHNTFPPVPGSNSNFAAQSLTLLNFQTATLNVVGDFSGLLNDQGEFTSVTIGGAFTSTGVLNAGAIDTMSVGGDFAGWLQVTGLLDTLAIGGGAPGTIVAGDVSLVTVAAGYGNRVLRVIEGGIERQIQAVPVSGGTLSDTLRFGVVYDSTGSGAPQAAIRITNHGEVVPHSFDLALVSLSSSAQFNLALVFATGATGLSNVAVSGDILVGLTAAEADYFGLPAGSRSGVNLPHDNITGVEVSGKLPIGRINVAGIEGLAFAVLTTAEGRIVNVLGNLGSSGNPQVLWNLLGSRATLLAATDAFRVPLNETQPVRLYAQVNPNPNLEYAMTLRDQSAEGAPVTAYVQLQPASTSSARPSVVSIKFVGDGGAVDSVFSVAAITSTGPLGDVTVRGLGGLGSLTASSLFGSINVTKGGITGTVQTTGVRIDPVTGAQTADSADLGRILYRGNKAVGVTTIYAKGAISGQIIARGNLVSAVQTKGAFSGVVAAQGDIGAVLRDAQGAAVTTPAGRLTRYGGLSFGGAASGRVIALGNIFGDITIKGAFTGRIAAQGRAVAGLAASRIGILGNLKLQSSFAPGAAIVSGGLVGDLVNQTLLTCSRMAGMLAADGQVRAAKTTKLQPARFFPDAQGSANGAVLDAIFTTATSALTFDQGGSLQGLGLIEADLNALQVSEGSLSGTNP
jgi:hypothetical protein